MWLDASQKINLKSWLEADFVFCLLQSQPRLIIWLAFRSGANCAIDWIDNSSKHIKSFKGHKVLKKCLYSCVIQDLSLSFRQFNLNITLLEWIFKLRYGWRSTSFYNPVTAYNNEQNVHTIAPCLYQVSYWESHRQWTIINTGGNAPIRFDECFEIALGSAILFRESIRSNKRVRW